MEGRALAKLNGAKDSGMGIQVKAYVDELCIVEVAAAPCVVFD
jgi:hypothetical protein